MYDYITSSILPLNVNIFLAVLFASKPHLEFQVRRAYDDLELIGKHIIWLTFKSRNPTGRFSRLEFVKADGAQIRFDRTDPSYIPWTAVSWV